MFGKRSGGRRARLAICAGLAGVLAFSASIDSAFADRRPDGGYDDVSASSWYYDCVMQASDAGLMSGYGGSFMFGPENTLLRSETAAVIANADHAEITGESKDETGMADLADASWYTGVVNWAVENGYIQGYSLPSGSLFGPSDDLTREQAAVILHRYATDKGADPKSYSKVAAGIDGWKSVSDWAKESVEWAVERNLLDGSDTSDGRDLEPSRPVLRAEMAKMMLAASTVIDNGMTNIDTDGDGEPDINIDVDGDGKPDLNIDTDGDGVPDKNIDSNGNGIADDKEHTGGVVIPDPTAKITVSSNTVYTGVEFSLDLKTTNAAKAEWTFSHDGKTYTDKDIAGKDGLGLEGGSIALKDSGKWTVTVKITGSNGHDVTIDTIIDVHKVAGVAFNLPKTTHTDKTIPVLTTLTNASSVTWALARDGHAIDLAEGIDGDLADGGGKINFKAPGTYKLTATITDTAGKSISCSQETVVYPVLSLDVETDTYAHIGTIANVTLSCPDLFGHDVEWSITRGSDATHVTDKDLSATLGNDGGAIDFYNSGTYTLTATVTDGTGRVFSDSAKISCYPVGTVGIFAPEWIHEDEDVDIVAELENLGDATVKWSATLDGDPIPLSDLFDGDLGNSGGRLTPKTSGLVQLTASFSDPSGMEFSDTTEFRIYPIPSISYELPHDVYTDTSVDISVDAKNLGSNQVEWLVDNTYGFQDWDTFIDGKLDSQGGSIKFKHAGTYKIVARVTDETGRVFVFDSGLKIETVVQPVLDLTFSLPDELVAGVSTRVRTYGDNGFLPVSWWLERDGNKVDIAKYVSGSLNAQGGDISFNTQGTYTLHAEMVDVHGRMFKAEDTVLVHPNVQYDISVDGTANGIRKHLGESFDVSVDAANIDGANIAWSVNGTDGNPLAWSSVFDGTLSDDGGRLSFVGKPGDFVLKATITDAYGGVTEHTMAATSYNEAPAAPAVSAQVDYKDMQGAFSDRAKVKVTITPSAKDPFGDGVTYEFASESSQTGYFALGEHAVKVRAKDEWGAYSDWTTQSFEVSNDAPAAPAVSAQVDYGDVQNAYTKNAKVKVTGDAVAGADRDATRIEWADESASTDKGAYLAKGSHVLKAKTVDAFGASSEYSAVTINLGVGGQADPTGNKYAAPTISIESSTLGNEDITESKNIKFNLKTTAGTPVTVKTVDYFNQSDRSNNTAASGSQSTDASDTYDGGRHLLVAQVKDVFGNAAYANRFFIVGSDHAGGHSGITSQTTVTKEEGVYDGKTPLAYIDSFVYDIPEISGHSSGGADYVIVKGIKRDGSTEQLLKCNSSSGKTHIDSEKGTWSTDTNSGTFSYKKDTYTKIEFTYYNDHPGCLAQATQGLSYTVSYSFIEDSGLEENFENLFK